ncbi:hypothetical protein [Pseudoteredinibacter isoporae]|uniref:hypothetical protein n=1 Tax=Pseudoteredinibacter isoporae TaxID=570281 RepID=UPI003101D1D4
MWKPHDDLLETLVDVGIDKDLLQTVTLDLSSSFHQLQPIQKVAVFTLLASSTYNHWIEGLENYVDVSELKDLLPPMKISMTKSWKPSLQTEQLLIAATGCDRADIGMVRLKFLDLNSGVKSRNWDTKFIEFILGDILGYQDSENSQPESKKANSKISAENLAINPQQQATIKAIIKRLLRHHHISYFFNITMKDDWQPSKWVVSKLIANGAPKRHIFNSNLLAAFRSWIQRKGDVTCNADIEYYLYSIQRLHKYKKYLLKDKEMFEAQIKFNSTLEP